MAEPRASVSPFIERNKGVVPLRKAPEFLRSITSILPRLRVGPLNDHPQCDAPPASIRCIESDEEAQCCKAVKNGHDIRLSGPLESPRNHAC